jgi:AhpD family alkylhydroperoxidase
MTTWHDYMENPVALKVAKSLITANRAITASALPSTINELVKIRASQINGCAFCVDMHTKDATAAGESPQRLHLVAAWREATVFTDAERAALELTEQGTRIADGSGVSDDAWADALLHFSEDEIAALVAQIVVINAFNRLNVIFGRPGGDYVVGQFD